MEQFLMIDNDYLCYIKKCKNIYSRIKCFLEQCKNDKIKYVISQTDDRIFAYITINQNYSYGLFFKYYKDKDTIILHDICGDEVNLNIDDINTYQKMWMSLCLYIERLYVKK